MTDAKRASLKKLLNGQFLEFVRAVSTVARSPDFALFPVLVETAIAADDNMVLAQLDRHMTDAYIERIEARDADFFRADAFAAEKAGELGGLDLFDKLRGEWDDMTEDNRAVVWGWLTNLTKILRKLRSLSA